MASIHDLLKGQRTLICLLQGMVGTQATIELRDESVVHGEIESVDMNMGVALRNCVLRNRQGSEQSFDSFFIIGRYIRYVHVSILYCKFL
jgi:small nuclear ribonucleoprotein (snRNP)-like protein